VLHKRRIAGSAPKRLARLKHSFAQRIAAAIEQLACREEDIDAGVIEPVTAMLGEHPWRRR
jgi:hypothetical protein